MNRRERTVSGKLDVRGKTINQIARWYFNDELFVNRRYQRKLVWSLKEKKLFIDSLMNKFPTPSIMINNFKVKIDGEEWLDRYEIIDGLQRLDAIFSFIKGEFGIDHDGEIKFFDVSNIPSAFTCLKKDRTWKEPDNLLPVEICADFADVELPVILSGQGDEKIEEIFRRINSSGKKLSSHDLRQAGCTDDFSDLVRRVSCRVRGDYTYENSIKLYDMPKISVSGPGLNYGVNIKEIFWRRHDIITESNLRSSKDEEVIETLIATALLKENFKKNKRNLDKLYETGTELNLEIENKVSELNKIKLEDEFSYIFDIIDMIFDSVHSDFSSYLFEKRNTKNKDECFKILFLAIYKLISEGYLVTDYFDVATCIKESKNIFDVFINTDIVEYEKIHLAIKNLYKILKPSFSKKIVTKNNEMEEEIDKRLGYSKLERQMTEFKIGISNFTSLSVNSRVIHDIAKTLVGMSNTKNAKEEGLLIIGIADTKKSYDTWHTAFGNQAIIISVCSLNKCKKSFGLLPMLQYRLSGCNVPFLL